MAGSKKKQAKQQEYPKGRHVSQRENPESYYQKCPSWSFNSCDTEKWPFTKCKVGMSFWDEILPRFQGLETQTWQQILVGDKKQNHSELVEQLNPIAQKRLAERCIEQDSIISLRISGKHRIYGYMVGAVFNILWYDTDHGDNDTCVCRSNKKHT